MSSGDHNAASIRNRAKDTKLARDPSCVPAPGRRLGSGETRAPRVAVLDDDLSVRTAFKRLLKTWDIQADLYATYDDFLSALDRQRPDCLILDFHMPDTDGLYIVRHMKEADIRLPVIVVSGVEDVPEEEFDINGAVSILRKPLSETQLLRAINDARDRDDPA
jgi:FixJ family two-component response regulator